MNRRAVVEWGLRIGDRGMGRGGGNSRIGTFTVGMVSALGVFVGGVGGCVGARDSAPVEGGDGPSGRRPSRDAYFDARSHVTEYAGAGREAVAPDDLEEIRIGWFGPFDLAHSEAGAMWAAATMAIEDANREGGYHGIPFRLVPAWSENPWGTGVRDVARLVYDDEVWAMIGAPDGPSAHLVEQVVAKARLPFVSPVSSDKTTNLANVPWTFSCTPGDHLQGRILARALASRVAGERFVVVSTADHDSRVFATEFLNACDGLGVYPNRRFVLSPPGADKCIETLESIRAAGPAAVVVVAGASETARFLVAMRNAGSSVAVLGGPAMGREVFVKEAGEAAEGVVFPLLWNPMFAPPRSYEFARRFCERFARTPDYAAAHTYDGVRLLVDAVRIAGLNRVRIRDRLRVLSPWHGVTGRIEWDPTGHNERRVELGTIRDGRIMPLAGTGP